MGSACAGTTSCDFVRTLKLVDVNVIWKLLKGKSVTHRLFKIGAALLAAALIAGCGTIAEKRKIDYRNTPTLPSLEVPPGLSSLPDQRLPGTEGGSATYSAYAGEQKNAPTREGV